MRSPRPSSPGRNSPGIGNTCSTARSSPRRRIRSGAAPALIAADGRLIGIGSLHVQRSNGRELRRDVNMVVPIDLLPPIIDDMLTYGRPNRPPRPWLGLYAAEVEDENAVVVAGHVGARTGDQERAASRATASSRCATIRSRASPRSGAGSGRAAPPAARSCCKSSATRTR